MLPASESATVKAPPYKISPEAFAFETRFVVLNYLGQVQPRKSSDGSSSQGSSGSSKLKLHSQSSSSSGSSHARPSSVSPRPPSVSPRPPESGGDGDGKIVGALAYDAKVKAIHAIAERGKTREAKERVNAEILRRGAQLGDTKETEQITLGWETIEGTDSSGDSGWRHPEMATKQAKVIKELKNMAQSRLEEIRKSFDDFDTETDDLKKPQDSRSVFPRFKQVDVEDKTKSSSDDDAAADKFLGGMRPLGGESKPDDDFPKGDRTSNQFHLQWTDTYPRDELVSPTRPRNLDGLHKTSDILEHDSLAPLVRPGKELSPRRQADATDTARNEKNRGPPPSAPPPSAPPRKVVDDYPPRSGCVESHHSRFRDASYDRSSYDRLFSKESEFSDMDSPSSDSCLTGSGRSVVSGTSSNRSSVINMNEMQVKALVKTSVLPEVALPLQEELTEQWQQWEKEYERAYLMLPKVSGAQMKDKSPIPVASLDSMASGQSDSLQGMSPMMSTTSTLSPESEVARKLGIIGDRIQEEMGELLDKAFNDIMAMPREQVTYEVLNRVVEEDRLLDNSSGWRQVAVLLAFSQRLTMGLLQKGERGLGTLMEYSVRLIEDRAAEFIINQGGWNAIAELDVSPLVSPSGDDPDAGMDGRYPLIELPVEPVGMNAVGSLLTSPDSALTLPGQGDASNSLGENNSAGERSVNIVTDGGNEEENSATGNEAAGGSNDNNTGAVTPDLLRDGANSSPRAVVSDIHLMRSISHEISREAEEARVHRLITRLTWGSIAAVVLAVGITLLWKWKPKNST